MIRLQLIRDHLAAAGTDLIEIGTARDFSAARAGAIRFPSAWIIPLSENSGRQIYESCGPLEQRVRFGFGAVLAMRDIAHRTSSQGLTEAEVVREQVMQVLARFKHPGADDVCIPQRGRLVSGLGKDGSMFWQDDYQIEFHRRIQGDTP